MLEGRYGEPCAAEREGQLLHTRQADLLRTAWESPERREERRERMAGGMGQAACDGVDAPGVVRSSLYVRSGRMPAADCREPPACLRGWSQLVHRS